MKKLTFSLIACFACFHALHADVPALTSPVNLSLQHYEAITRTLATHPDFQKVIPEGEFITNLRIQRRSINVTEGNVFVNITTRPAPSMKKEVVGQESNGAAATEQTQLSRHRYNGRCKNRRANGTKTYMATLLLTPSNEGTTAITVVSIEPRIRQYNKSAGKEGYNSRHSKPEVVTLK